MLSGHLCHLAVDFACGRGGHAGKPVFAAKLSPRNLKLRKREIVIS
jgi:hypothetical protein